MAFKSIGSLARVGSNSLTVNRPSVVEGDLMLLYFNGKNSDRTWTYPAGWTLIQEHDVNSSFRNQIAILYKVATASEPASYTITNSGTSPSIAIIAVYDGVDQVSPITDSAKTENASNTASICPSISALSGDFLVCFYGTIQADTADRRYTPAAGMVERYDNKEAGGLETDFGISDQTLTSDGATGTRTFARTGTAQISMDISIALKQASGGTPPTGTVTIGTITKTSTTATVPYTYSAADQTGFEYRLNGGTPVADAASPVDLTGLTASTSYDVEVRAVNASGAGAWSAVANFTTDAGADTDPPTFTVAPAVTSISTTTATVTATINETGNIYHVIVPQADATPSVAQVKAGQNSAGSAPVDSGSALATTTISDPVSGLTAGTNYKMCMVAEDDELTPNIQAAVTTANFTTSAVAVGTITITNIAQNNDVKWSSTAIDAATVMPVGLGSVVVNKTGLTTTAGTSPSVTFSDAAIITGTEYIVILKIGTAYGWYRTTAT